MASVILRWRIVNFGLRGAFREFMTVAASLEQAGHYPLGVHGGRSHWRRLAILLGLVVSDLACFAVADGLLRLLVTPPALALFHNRSLGQPQTSIDLVMIIALVFVGARYLVGDYSRRQLFWDGARSTTTALLVSGVAYNAAVSLLEPSGLVGRYHHLAGPDFRAADHAPGHAAPAGQDRRLASADRHHRHQPHGAGSCAGAGQAAGIGPEGAMGGAGDGRRSICPALLPALSR